MMNVLFLILPQKKKRKEKTKQYSIISCFYVGEKHTAMLITD